MSKYHTLDYQALRYGAVESFERWRRHLIIYFLIGFIVMVLINFFNTDPIGVDWLIGFVIIYFALLLVLAFVPFVRRRISLLAAYSPAVEAFAADNNFDYQPLAKPHYGLFRPSLENLGLFSREEQLVTGRHGDYPLSVYVHTYRHPFAYRFNRVATRVYQITLPKRLPHIFLATRRGEGTSLKTNFMTHFDDDQRVDLEGNFSKHFVVYTHRRNRTEALSILAPNLMTTLIDTNKDFNIEIIGDQLYLYGTDYLPLEEDIRHGYTVLTALLKHLDHQLKSFQLVLPNDKKFPFLRSRPGFGTVTFGGKYFNASILAIVWYVGFNILRLSHSAVSRRTKLIEAVLVAIMALVMLAVLLVFRRRYKSSLIAQ